MKQTLFSKNWKASKTKGRLKQKRRAKQSTLGWFTKLLLDFLLTGITLITKILRSFFFISKNKASYDSYPSYLKKILMKNRFHSFEKLSLKNRLYSPVQCIFIWERVSYVWMRSISLQLLQCVNMDWVAILHNKVRLHLAHSGKLDIYPQDTLDILKWFKLNILKTTE